MGELEQNPAGGVGGSRQQRPQQEHASGRAEVACSLADQDLSAAKRRLALTKARNRSRKTRVFTCLAHPQLLAL